MPLFIQIYLAMVRALSKATLQYLVELDGNTTKQSTSLSYVMVKYILRLLCGKTQESDAEYRFIPRTD